MAESHITKQAVIKINGINPYIHISAKEASVLRPDWRRPMPVCVQVNNQPETPWHINMVPMGDGDFYLYLHQIVRTAADVKVGDAVLVAVWFDEAYRGGPQDEFPDWFARPLRANKQALAAWHLLTPSRQKEVLRYFARLQSPEAKDRNLTLVLSALSGKPTHFLGRDWINGK